MKRAPSVHNADTYTTLFVQMDALSKIFDTFQIQETSKCKSICDFLWDGYPTES